MPCIWQNIQKTNIRKISQLIDFLKLNEEKQKRLINCENFPLNLPLRLASKIEKNTLNDPILKQFVPLDQELIPNDEYLLDPLKENLFREKKSLIHKYKERVLIIASSSCVMHCRFCFRKNFDYLNSSFEEEIDYIKNDPSIKEVILSGGDPLSLSNTYLSKLLNQINRIEHIKRIRIHSRFILGIPERIDSGLLEIFKNIHKQIYFTLHVNHPLEIDKAVLYSTKKLQLLGIIVITQTVLLSEVNDSVKTLKELFLKLVDNGIIPYYLHMLDKVTGVKHFEVSEKKALSLLKELQKNLSGYALPRLVREDPGCESKTILF